MDKIKVLIIEDSAVTRQVLNKIISGDAELEVIDSAIDPFIALKKIEKNKPDVITLDLELPRMDGLTFLKNLMAENPIPVVVISSLTDRGSRKAIHALELGAVEVITKPEVSSPAKLENVSLNIRLAIKSAFQAKVRRRISVPLNDNYQKIAMPSKKITRTESTTVMAIGASTGGTEAIKNILTSLSTECPGVLIVQHMPEVFTKSFADRLNQLCAIEVKEAEDLDEVVNGRALIAPGNRHMILVKRQSKFVIRLLDDEKVNRHRPSVDVLFKSVANEARSQSLGVLLTGMGEDGANGLLEIRNTGGFTIAQNKETSIVFGMPRRAIEIGAAMEVLSLKQIATTLNNIQIKSL
jgi:two-component system, chemotaxis family, protein-glutamate methylesterase/glutaminase